MNKITALALTLLLSIAATSAQTLQPSIKELQQPPLEISPDAVRSVLSAAEANREPPIPEFADTESRLAYLRWLDAMSERLKVKKSDPQTRKELLQTVWYESRRAGLDTALVLGLIQVESNFRKFNVAANGARGYMGVGPQWAKMLGDGDVKMLFHLQTNLRFGCVILRGYLDQRHGDLFLGLSDYYEGNRVGAVKGQTPREFAQSVVSYRQNWVYSTGTKANVVSANIAELGNVEDGISAVEKGEYQSAFKSLLPRAEKGDAVAQAWVGHLYETGKGVAPDPVKSLKWYLMAANQGERQAQRSVGAYYYLGTGGTKDYREALKWFRLSAAQGDPTAQSVLGLMYLEGLGVVANAAEAAHWMQLAAVQGDMNSQLLLGSMHQAGRGVAQDDVEALKWYQLAADQGSAAAQERIKTMRIDAAQRQQQRGQQQRDQEQQNRRCNDINDALATSINDSEAAYAALVASRPSDLEISARSISQSPITPTRGWAGSAMAGAGASEAVSNAHAEYARADYDHRSQMATMRSQIAITRANAGCP